MKNRLEECKADWNVSGIIMCSNHAQRNSSKDTRILRIEEEDMIFLKDLIAAWSSIHYRKALQTVNDLFEK